MSYDSVKQRGWRRNLSSMTKEIQNLMTISWWDRNWGERKEYELSHSARLGSHEIGEAREEVSIQARCSSWLQAHRERATACRIRARDCREHRWRGGS